MELADGSTQYFYTTQYHVLDDRDYYDYAWFIIVYFNAYNKIIRHKQEQIFVPVWTAKRNLEYSVDIPRKLSDEDTTPLMSREYFALFTVAQLGGLYVTLVLIFGIIVNCLTNKCFNQSMINRVYKYNIEHMEAEEVREDFKLPYGIYIHSAFDIDQSLQYEDDLLNQSEIQEEVSKDEIRTQYHNSEFKNLIENQPQKSGLNLKDHNNNKISNTNKPRIITNDPPNENLFDDVTYPNQKNLGQNSSNRKQNQKQMHNYGILKLLENKFKNDKSKVTQEMQEGGESQIEEEIKENYKKLMYNCSDLLYSIL